MTDTFNEDDYLKYLTPVGEALPDDVQPALPLEATVEDISDEAALSLNSLDGDDLEKDNGESLLDQVKAIFTK